MFQFMAPVPSDGPKFSREASEIERFRARHRRLCRGQQAATPPPKIDSLDVDNGRTRKISAKWRQKQQLRQHRNQHDDGIWPKSAGTEMHLGYNAFDFSASPEAFYDEGPGEVQVTTTEANQQDGEGIYEEQSELSVETNRISSEQDEQQKREQHMANVAKQVTSMGFNSASRWERMFPGLRQPGGPIQQMPTFGQTLWGAPVHFTTYDQRRALYYQPA